MPSNFTRGQLRISASPYRKSYDELSIVSFMNITLMSYPFILAWGETQAGNDYFMKKNRGLPCDDILQYEAERNACLLYNKVHRNAPIEEFPPYEDIVEAADIQLPMPDEPPVPPPRAPVQTRPTLTPGEMPHQEHTKAAIGHLQVQADKEEVEGSLLNHHNLPLHLSDGRYRAIQHLQRHPLLLYLGNSSLGTSLPTTNSNQRS